MSEEYWDGALWVYHADITRDGSTSGTDTIDIVPGAGNEMEVLYGMISHDDGTGRQVRAAISTDNVAERITYLANGVVTSSFMDFPQEGASGNESGPSRKVVAGPMTLRLTIESLAVGKKAIYAVVCRIRGAVPTVTVTKPADSVLVTNKNAVM